MKIILVIQYSTISILQDPVRILLYLIVANPGTYKIVGSSVGLEKYDDFRSHDRHYLLFVHGIVFAVVVYIALSIYNPFTNIPKMIHKSKILHKPKIPQK